MNHVEKIPTYCRFFLKTSLKHNSSPFDARRESEEIFKEYGLMWDNSIYYQLAIVQNFLLKLPSMVTFSFPSSWSRDGKAYKNSTDVNSRQKIAQY